MRKPDYPGLDQQMQIGARQVNSPRLDRFSIVGIGGPQRAGSVDQVWQSPRRGRPLMNNDEQGRLKIGGQAGRDVQ